MIREVSVRRFGPDIWRPSIGVRLMYVALAVLIGGGLAWGLVDGEEFSRLDLVKVVFGAGIGAVLLPVVLFRQRMVLERDELVLVFLRVRRVALREIVDAKCVAKEGLTFVLRDSSEVSFGALGNTAWAHRRATPTRADLAARAVLCAAARLRGEDQPLDFRLPPLTGLKAAAIEGGIWAFVVGMFVGD